MKSVLLLAAIVAGLVSAWASASALDYDGGPVVSNAQVVLVNWSNDVSAAQASVPAFYADVVGSDYWSIMEQYATPTVPVQTIGFGTFVKTVTLTNPGCPSGCTVHSEDVDAYMQSLINSNDPILPPLSKDSAGRLNTIFMVHFAPNVTLTVQQESSCTAFLGTYDNITVGTGANSTIVPIGLVPDCSTEFPVTLASSGVLTDIVTDPQVYSNPAWFENEDGKDIAYICESSEDYEADISINGHTYTVSPLWSNSSNKCISAERIFFSGFDAVSN